MVASPLSGSCAERWSRTIYWLLLDIGHKIYRFRTVPDRGREHYVRRHRKKSASLAPSAKIPCVITGYTNIGPAVRPYLIRRWRWGSCTNFGNRLIGGDLELPILKLFNCCSIFLINKLNNNDYSQECLWGKLSHEVFLSFLSCWKKDQTSILACYLELNQLLLEKLDNDKNK